MSCNYSLLLRFNDAISATAPVDSTDAPITCSYQGEAGIRSLAADHFAVQSSCYFPSGSDYVSVTDDASVQLGGEFTIDFWVRFDDVTTNSVLFTPDTDPSNYSLKLELDTLLKLTSKGTAAAELRYYNPTFVNDAWYHIALTRDISDDIQLYIDGVLQSGGDYNSAYDQSAWSQDEAYTQTTGLKIGVIGSGGYIDGFRIIKGSIPTEFQAAFDSEIDAGPYCLIYGCINPDAFNYNPLADVDQGTSLCIESSFWNTPDLGVVFKANALDTAGSATQINIQGIQKDTWTQVNFRNEGFDTAGQYFPAISTFKPSVAGKYNLRAQIQVQDVLGYTPSGTDEHRIMAAIYHNGVAIEQNTTSIEHYYPDDPKEDTTVVVETIVELTEQDIIDGNNEFTAYVYIKGVREYEIDDKYNLCADTIGCTDLGADNTGTGTGASSAPAGMVLVSAGNFKYGPPTGSDTWEEIINLPAFHIDTYEVTAAEYKACVDAPGSPCSYGGPSGVYNYDNSKANHPMNYINWQEAVDYCTWVGKRLPTEFEWEKAARGTDGDHQPWGNNPAIPTCTEAVIDVSGSTSAPGCGGNSTWVVGQKAPGISPYGAYDMIGNVGEWTNSWYSSNQIYRTNRGGSFRSTASVYNVYERDQPNPSTRYDSHGFRCAQSTEAVVTIDDGSCYYEPGCTNPDYKEYWDLVNAGTVIDFPDDSLCLTKVVFGCTDSTATNYNEDAEVDDGSCIVRGCTDSSYSNFNASANFDDGSCEDTT